MKEHPKQKTDLPRKRALLMYFIVSLFLFFEMAVQVSPAVMANQLMHDLDMGAFGLGLMSSFYFYSYTAMQIPSGVLFDRFNPRWIITLAILICSIGTGLFGLSVGIMTASLARLFMGLGSAFAFVAVLVVTADLFPAKYFAVMTGITQMLGALGAMSGQLPISLLVSHIGWRASLYLLTLMGIILALLVWFLLDYRRVNCNRVIHNKFMQIRKNLKIIVSSKQTWFIALYACLLWAPMSGFASLWGVPFLMHIDYLSPHSAAFVCSFMWLGLAIASPVLGHISTILGNRKKPLAFSAAIGGLSFTVILTLHLPMYALILLIFLAGAACAGQALSFTVVKENHASHMRASAIAFNNMAVVISGALFQPIIGRLIALYSNRAVNYHITDYKRGLLLILLAYIIAFIVAFVFIREPKIEK